MRRREGTRIKWTEKMNAALLQCKEKAVKLTKGDNLPRNGNSIKDWIYAINPLTPNNDLSQTCHCNIKCLSVSEVMRIENMITQAKFY